MLCGYQPFFDEDVQTLFAQIKQGAVEFESPDWDDVSQATIDLVRNMLEPDPARRPTASQLLAHHAFGGE
jgi:serine/threonine protein kinase